MYISPYTLNLLPSQPLTFSPSQLLTISPSQLPTFPPSQPLTFSPFCYWSSALQAMHYALCSIPILSLKRSAPQVKRSLSHALIYLPSHLPTFHLSHSAIRIPKSAILHHSPIIRYSLIVYSYSFSFKVTVTSIRFKSSAASPRASDDTSSVETLQP